MSDNGAANNGTLVALQDWKGIKKKSKNLEKKPPSSAKKSPPSRFVPDDFELTESRFAYALKQGLTPAEVQWEFENFHLWEFRFPKVDFERTWQRWCRVAVMRRAEQPHYRPRRPTADERQLEAIRRTAKLFGGEP